MAGDREFVHIRSLCIQLALGAETQQAAGRGWAEQKAQQYSPVHPKSIILDRNVDFPLGFGCLFSKSCQKPCVFEHRPEEVIKNLVFLSLGLKNVSKTLCF